MAIINNNMKYNQLKEVFLKLTYLLRGYTLEDFEDEYSEAQNLIRYAYEKTSQPFQKIEEGTTYVWINYADSNASKSLNINKEQINSTQIKITKSKLRKIDVHWIFYGEQAPDLSYEMSQAIYSKTAKDFMDLYNIKLIPNAPESVLLFEEIQNQNWPRVEFTASYYLETQFEEVINNLSGAEIKIYTENGIMYDKEVSE